MAKKTVAVGQAVETDVSQKMDMFVRTGQSVETDVANAISAQHVTPAAQSTEADSATAVRPWHRANVSQVVAGDASQVMTPFLFGPGWSPNVLEIRLFGADGVVDGFAPDWQKVDFTALFSDEGTVTMDYPKNGIAYDRVTTPNQEGALFLNNVEVDGSRFLVSEMSGDRIKVDEVMTIQAITWVSRLKEAIVYPPNWPAVDPPDYTFSVATVGKIMLSLLTLAAGRGVQMAQQTVVNFTETHDSAGNPWEDVVTITLKAGTNLLEVLKSLSNLGMCDYTTKGRELYIVNAYTLGVDRTTTPNPVVLFHGRDVADAPRNLSVRDMVSTALVAGEEGVFVETVDIDAVNAWSRRETYVSQSGVSDTTTLDVIGRATIDINDHPREELTHTLTFHTSGPMALVDYKQGDMILTDMDGTQNAYKVLQIRISWDATGQMTGGLTLNDRFDALEVKLQQQIDGFSGVVVSPVPPSGPGGGEDTSTPGKPVFTPPFQSQTYTDAVGVTKARAIITWTAPNNTDGTPVVDGDHYEIRWRLDTDVQYTQTWSSVSTVTWGSLDTWGEPFTPETADWQTMYVGWGESSAVIHDLVTGVGFDVQIRAADANGNVGDWSDEYTFVTVDDRIPPSTPAPPTVAGSQIALQITHTLGKATGGTYNLEYDLDHLEIHVDVEELFRPSTTTLMAKVQANAGMLRAQIPIVTTVQVQQTTPLWVKVIAVDKSGNKSGASVGATATAVLIDDQYISHLTVSKITAGVINSDWIVSARIKTADAGARVELSSAGLQAFDDAGVQTVDISSGDGSVDIIGKFSSGPSGRRLVINPLGVDADPEIRMYENETHWHYITAYVDQAETLQIGSVLEDTTNQKTVVELRSDQLTLGVFTDTPSSLTDVCTIRFHNTGLIETGGGTRIGNPSGLNFVVQNGPGANSDFRGFWDGSQLQWVRNDTNSIVKSFVIDHPSVADRYLVHACTESPQNGVEYWGTALLDGTGLAVVSLPEYFEDLTLEDGRAVFLSLMSHGNDASNLVGSYPEDGVFTITGPPMAKVAWLVKASRADVPKLDVEPLKEDVTVYGDGPYRYLVRKDA